MNIIVIKRDGRKEPFDMKKIARVMGAAGLTSEQTEQVTEQISSWVKSLNAKEITSMQVRDKILEILPPIDQHSADLFAWYQKTKEE